ncbi:hypothetical protein [Paenibacillus endoradicis]|uniref:hypothetical protein n=1 Tax=Paenibacillus endoradicis TaxID=2972487 RepID=UPI002158E5FA|nr:hypothetical protein [Paenibacillus endoradicis]MCR8657310.1 hypothetical protein [Paenibacillus endoradicis]
MYNRKRRRATKVVQKADFDNADYAEAAYSAAKMPFIACFGAHVPETYVALLTSLASWHLLGSESPLFEFSL